VGIIERDVLITLIEHQAWYYPDELREANFGTEGKEVNKNMLSKRMTHHSSINVANDDDYMEVQDPNGQLLQDDMHNLHNLIDTDSDHDDYSKYPL
jgi:hypothetical protein